MNKYLLCMVAVALVGMACREQPALPANAAALTPPAEQAATTTPAPEPVSVEYLTGRFKPAEHPDFVAVEKPYTDKTGMMLRRETFEAFKKMWEAAQKDGIVLRIISSTRNFDQQKGIWEGKWERFAKETPDEEARAHRILEYSSMPGASRHHWGTDIDLNDLNNATFEGTGKYASLYQWLGEHAHEYGFCQPYTAGRPYGYKEEKWHWSYTPLSRGFLQQYAETVKDEAFSGFKGAGMAAKIGIVEHYALGINQECK